jgi:hypothetical protein
MTMEAPAAASTPAVKPPPVVAAMTSTTGFDWMGFNFNVTNFGSLFSTTGVANDDRSDIDDDEYEEESDSDDDDDDHNDRDAVDQNDYYDEDQGPVVDQADETRAIVNQPEDDDGDDDAGEDALAGPVQPAVRRSGRTPTPCASCQTLQIPMVKPTAQQ